MKVRVKQIRSKIGSKKKKKRTLQAIGLRKIGTVVEKEATPQVLGMINKVLHLVVVESI